MVFTKTSTFWVTSQHFGPHSSAIFPKTYFGISEWFWHAKKNFANKHKEVEFFPLNSFFPEGMAYKKISHWHSKNDYSHIGITQKKLPLLQIFFHSLESPDTRNFEKLFYQVKTPLEFAKFHLLIRQMINTLVCLSSDSASRIQNVKRLKATDLLLLVPPSWRKESKKKHFSCCHFDDCHPLYMSSPIRGPRGLISSSSSSSSSWWW